MYKNVVVTCLQFFFLSFAVTNREKLREVGDREEMRKTDRSLCFLSSTYMKDR